MAIMKNEMEKPLDVTLVDAKSIAQILAKHPKTTQQRLILSVCLLMDISLTEKETTNDY